MFRKLAIATLLMMTCASGAWALSKGSSMFAVEFTDGSADLADLGSGFTIAGGDYIRPYSVPEVGVQGQYWYLMADDYALTLAAGVGLSRTTLEPANGSLPGAPDLKANTNSFNIRIGGDRVVRVGERAVLYGGPGVEFWSGKAKYEDFGITSTASYTGVSTKRFGFSARLGGTMLINPNFGLTSHVGHRFGRASVEELGAKTSWWASSFEGSMGFVFMYGGK